ncbi:nitroreductase family protein [Imhoffiella purpurea]|uniref:Ferredoxin n=1 Tax=Imhoffiella purpurea TaxID=1249627 RepID=W9VT38_9GAMM|nr:nitroreductase family protein [Imhoffiella purpurea]EXJ13545.1 Ferredoxin [Imhoffiella purpurea]
MAIPTSRTTVAATIQLDPEHCNGCGLCVAVCKDDELVLTQGRVAFSGHPLFGCIGCGHCMAICPTGAIRILGRTLSPDDLFDLPERESAAPYASLHALLQRRRSIREFQERPVEPELIDKILAAAQTAPMGIPPSDVHLLVLDGQEKVTAFARDFCDYLDGMRWLVSDWMLRLMRPFWGKANDALFRDFVRPTIDTYTERMRQGVNMVTYDAPLAIYFYGSAYCDPADPIVAATYAMIAGESLGLGTCMIGSIHPMIQHGRKAKEFREAHGIRSASREGLFVIFGHPHLRYRQGIRRTFAAIDWVR